MMCQSRPFPLTVSAVAPVARRHTLLILTLLGGLLAAGLLPATRLVVRGGAPGRAYTVAAVRRLVDDRAPARWPGRELVVRALIEPCPWWGAAARREHCAGQPLVLVAAPTDQVAAPLPLVRAAPGLLETIARRLPLLGGLLRPRSQVQLFTTRLVRVRLQPLPAGACGRAPCYAARLLAAFSEDHPGARRRQLLPRRA